MRPARTALTLLLALGLATGSTACGGSSGEQGGQKELTVLAASSLTGTFTDLAKRFEQEHPAVTVRLVFDSSATLAQKAIDHAPGDVLATADQKTMEQAQQGKGTSGAARQFASNIVMLAVPKDNPAGITSFGDLSNKGVKLVTCVTTAPCGAAAQALLAEAHVSVRPVSQEVDVKAVLAKVVADEADAGLVYRTDVTAAGDTVKGIDVPGAKASPNIYWVARTTVAKGDLASDWIKLLESAEGRQVLDGAGFSAPTE